MQDQPTALPQWLLTVLQNLVVFGAGGLIVRLITLWLNRKKPKVEVLALEASAQKTRAEARKLDGESLNLAWERIDELILENFDLRKQLDLCEIRSRHHEIQERRMLALMELHGIKYKEFDGPK